MRDLPPFMIRELLGRHRRSSARSSTGSTWSLSGRMRSLPRSTRSLPRRTGSLLRMPRSSWTTTRSAGRESRSTATCLSGNGRREARFLVCRAGWKYRGHRNGAGLTMATLDLIEFYGGKAANFLDVGGGAGERARDERGQARGQCPAVKVIVVNLLGGITKCDEVAKVSSRPGSPRK